MPDVSWLTWVLSILEQSGLVCYSCNTSVRWGLRFESFVLVERHSLCLGTAPARAGPRFLCFGVSHSLATLCLVGHVPWTGPLVLGCCLGFGGRSMSCIGLVRGRSLAIGNSAGMGLG